MGSWQRKENGKEVPWMKISFELTVDELFEITERNKKVSSAKEDADAAVERMMKGIVVETGKKSGVKH